MGRAQELVYSLHRLYRAGQIPEIPIYVDSPLAVDVTTVFRLHPEVFDRRERLIETTNELFDFPLLRYVRDVADSKAHQRPDRTRGHHRRVRHGRVGPNPPPPGPRHRRSPEPGPLCRVSGGAHPRPADPGRRGDVRILGQEYERRAEVETIGGYSAHADRDELRAWVRRLGGPVRRAFVVHGEPGRARGHGDILREEGVRRRPHPEARGELRVVEPGRRSAALVSPCLGLMICRCHRLHRGAGHGAGGEPAGPAPAGRCHRGTRRRPVQRPAVTGAPGPARSCAAPVPRRARPPDHGHRRRGPGRHHQRGHRGRHYPEPMESRPTPSWSRPRAARPRPR